ncbi:hypothetical protein [Nakamurella endophytica]|uniref:Uncharacterized protein n=1 Tax=Nakamurella endophytica TaxID=1748367 RepID=A0A917SYG3_9ACTN|nr:hypothetical protein [Nakamurella endophytica]GGM02625.1 hypothetical protein GCM10011594_23430 [Nakamurella endophytica]
MIAGLAYGLLAAGLVLALWTGIQGGRHRPTTEAQMVGAIVVEAGLLVQAVLALVRLSSAHLSEPVTFVAYTVGVLLPLPLGFQLARIERTQWGSAALCFTAVVVAVMNLRLLALWRG